MEGTLETWKVKVGDVISERKAKGERCGGGSGTLYTWRTDWRTVWPVWEGYD